MRNKATVTAGAAVRLTAAAMALGAANAATYNVSPNGNPMTLTAALAVAGAGDTISLGDGLYDKDAIVTMKGGEEGNPLVIEGGKGAVLNFFSGDRSLMWSQKVVDIRHSWITLRGFTVNGQMSDEDREESFIDKCIWVEGQDSPKNVQYAGRTVKSSLIGTVIEDMKIQNCGMECIRMRNWVTNSIIRDNDLEDCGIYDFRYQFDGKIGEAIYIGTSSNQWTDGADGCNYNLVTNNKLVPRGNECVDIKEGATMNVVEYNECSDQRDAESGCFDSRGNENVFRFNTAEKCLGAGVRLGGHEIDGFEYGVDNHVYENDFEETEEYSIKSRRHPQGVICGNSCKNGECRISEEGDDEEIEDSWDKSCDSDDFPVIPFIDDMDSSPTPTPPTPTPPTPTPPTPSPPTPTPTPPTSTDGANYLGCFIDKKDSGRVFGKVSTSQQMTTAKCMADCAGFAYFGTQYGEECWCGTSSDDYDKHGEVNDSECNVDCSGDDDETCGGFWRIAVYSMSSGGGGSFVCDGVQENEYCCSAGCGECGGKGCSSRGNGLTGDDCCQSDISKNGKMCSATGAAPCIMDGTSDADASSDSSDSGDATSCDGIQSNEYCCTSGCGECGGTGCSSRGNGLTGDDCCQSDIKRNGKKCSSTGGQAPCLLD